MEPAQGMRRSMDEETGCTKDKNRDADNAK